MRLLVSVASAQDALAALAGGADVIDAKDPSAGALGAVSTLIFRDIHQAVGGTRPVTAALGDAVDEASVEHHARRFSADGATLVKVGFAGIDTLSRAAVLASAAVRGAAMETDRHAGVVLVAYADSSRVCGLQPRVVIELARRVGAKGVLLDTAEKNGAGLRDLMTQDALIAWTADAHAAGLLVAMAGKLTADDLAFVRDTNADIVGVRGAACEGGRSGRVSVERVSRLMALCVGESTLVRS